MPDADIEARRAPGEQPREVRVAVNGTELAIWEWPGGGPPVVLAHGIGHHGRVWDEVVRRLPGRRVLSVDLRGHGRSAKGGPPVTWPLSAEDLEMLLSELDLRGAIGCGHSFGASILAYAGAHVPGAFASMLLVDPTISADRAEDERAQQEPVEPRDPAQHPYARRRNQFDSADVMYARFEDRLPFARWDRQVLRDYCVYGLRPTSEGPGFALACPPIVEGEIYSLGMLRGMPVAFGHLDIPVRILRARDREDAEDEPQGFEPTQTGRGAEQFFPRAELVELPEYSHHLSLEAPALVARHLEEVCRLAEG
ncbi:MAG: alpha/beta fold hydrolase [Dehalococcoidia bacterium]|nr:alpha/beta fold hydrolase [Dehalococcoidia bacterium]